MPSDDLENVYQFFQNKPIASEDFNDLYVNVDKGRGIKRYETLRRRLLSNTGGSLKMLFVGHKGCGKSTELVRLQRDIAREYETLNFSVSKELDLLNINHIELFIATMEQLFELFDREPKIILDPQHIQKIHDWMKTREVKEVNETYMGMEIEAGMKAGGEIPFFASFFAKFRAAAKSSSSLKEILKTKMDPKLSQLIENCNLLIGDVRKNLHKIGKKGLLLIIEDLDKADLKMGEELFYVHSTQMTQLDCHCIFTFPIALLYNTRFTAIRNSYDEAFVLPMIKVREKDGNPFEEGIQALETVVTQRMNISLFEEKTVLRDMILYSGGCLWDLFRIIRDAADNALNHERSEINREDFHSAYLSLKSDYYFTIADNKEKGITAEEYYQTLKQCALDKTKKPESTEAMLDLRNNLTVLGYNGDQWSDVHPIVRDILKEKGLIQDETKK